MTQNFHRTSSSTQSFYEYVYKYYTPKTFQKYYYPTNGALTPISILTFRLLPFASHPASRPIVLRFRCPSTASSPFRGVLSKTGVGNSRLAVELSWKSIYKEKIDYYIYKYRESKIRKDISSTNLPPFCLPPVFITFLPQNRIRHHSIFSHPKFP